LESPFQTSLAIWQRVLLLVAGSGLLSMLIVAACLSPDPNGMGTHQQLGLPPCSMVQWFQLRCPACGMTTSWSLMMHGQPGIAFAANSGGALLALGALVSAPWMLVTAVAGRYLLAPPSQEWLVAITLSIAGVTLVDWIVRNWGVVWERWPGS
jgi:hypothetical protein